MFADEKVLETISGLHPPYSHLWTIPFVVILMFLSVFVASVQTFVFILLSQLYLSEVSHQPHDEHAEHGHAEDESKEFMVPVLN